jgi:hypothetical protein
MSNTSFTVGDVIRNCTTNEQGRIVRIVDRAYIVSLPPTNLWPAKEVLWRDRDVKRAKA